MNVLHICADPTPTEESVAKQLAASFFSKLIEVKPDAEISNVDLYSEPPPYMAYEAYRGHWYPVQIEGYQATGKELAAMEYGIQQAEQFNKADVLVMTVPMWTSSVPGILKSWLDYITAPGHTYSLSGDGIKPLHRLTKVVLLVSSMGSFKENDPADALSSEINAAMHYLGLYDISIAWADGQDPLKYADSELRKEMAMEAAEELAEDLVDLG